MPYLLGQSTRRFSLVSFKIRAWEIGRSEISLRPGDSSSLDPRYLASAVLRCTTSTAGWVVYVSKRQILDGVNLSNPGRSTLRCKSMAQRPCSWTNFVRWPWCNWLYWGKKRDELKRTLTKCLLLNCLDLDLINKHPSRPMHQVKSAHNFRPVTQPNILYIKKK